MKFSLLHPSYNRPELCLSSYLQVLTRCDMIDNMEHIVSLNANEPQLNRYTELLTGVKNTKLIVRPSVNCVQALNEAAKVCTGDILVYMCEDFVFPNHWDTSIKDLSKGKLDDDWVMWAFDGFRKDLMCLCILSRKYFNRFGYVYYPEYSSMYADDEFTAVAQLLGRIIDIREQFTIMHNHYSHLGRSQDLTYKIQNDPARMESGKQLFTSRKAKNFDLPVK